MEDSKNLASMNSASLTERTVNPQYIGYSGKVYDVTDSIEWAEGDHLGHTAGQDLSEAMEIAPHGSEILERMKVVGVLSEQ